MLYTVDLHPFVTLVIRTIMDLLLDRSTDIKMIRKTFTPTFKSILEIIRKLWISRSIASKLAVKNQAIKETLAHRMIAGVHSEFNPFINNNLKKRIRLFIIRQKEGSLLRLSIIKESKGSKFSKKKRRNLRDRLV